MNSSGNFAVISEKPLSIHIQGDLTHISLFPIFNVPIGYTQGFSHFRMLTIHLHVPESLYDGIIGR